MSEVTRILDSIDQGDTKAAEQLLPLVYEELRRLATHKMAHEPPGQTLQATALVHEAYLKLVGSQRQEWNNRAHFFSAAAEAMRRILVDNARRKRNVKHGGDLERIDFSSITAAVEHDSEKLLRVHEVLDQLAIEDPVKAEVVKLRYFVGLKHREVASAMGLSEATVRRHWTFSRAWLYQAMRRLN